MRRWFRRRVARWKLLLGLAGLLAGCPRPTPPVAVPGVVAPAPALCSTGRDVSPEDVCDGLFTTEGLACVRCEGAGGCVDPEVVVYCATGPCALDPRCGRGAP